MTARRLAAAPRQGRRRPPRAARGCRAGARAASALAAVVLIAAAGGRAAAAGEPAAVSRIVGGQEVGTCQLAATVMLQSAQGVCSGSLVHPSIVIYAAHCGPSITDIFFGEHISRWVAGVPQLDQPGRRVSLPAGSCKTYPGADPSNGSDFAYCRLPEPVVDVPIVPVLMGCEVAMLDAAQQVAIAGYGWLDTTSRQTGVKRLATAPSQPQSANKIQIGDKFHVSCHGDSGGPAFVQLPRGSALVPEADNTWRLFGIVSYGPESCQGASVYSLVHRAVPWIEADSGVDITPCGDALGTWAPTALCGGFPTSLTAAAGAWPNGCRAGGGAGGLSATCGAPYVALGPQLKLLSPTASEPLAEGTQTTVEVEVSGATAVAGGVAASIDDQPMAQLGPAVDGHFTFGPVVWAPGTHTLLLQAKDVSGRAVEQQVVLQVAAGGAAAAAGEGASPAPMDTFAGGCRAAGGRLAWPWAAGLAAAAWRRGRRRRGR